MQSIVAATGGGSLDDFLQTTTASCDGCIELAKDIGQNPTEVQRFEGAPEISGAEIATKDGDDLVVDQSVSVPAGKKVRTAASSVVRRPGHLAGRSMVRGRLLGREDVVSRLCPGEAVLGPIWSYLTMPA